MTATAPGPRADDAALHLLAEHLVTALESDQIAPSLLHVRPDGDAFDLGIRDLVGHPTDELLGLTAPVEWHAVGIATHGWAYHLDGRGDPTRRRHRVHVVSLVSRTGEHAHRTLVADADGLANRLADEDPVGEQVDLLRRSLGLATDPPPCDSVVYWTIEWLAALVSDSVARPTTWTDAVSRHPAMQLLDHEPTTIEADTVDVIAGFQRVCDWRRLRHLTAESAFRAPDLRAEHAWWLDDGAFARFVLNRCPPLATLRARAVDRLPTALADQIEDTLTQLGIPHAAWLTWSQALRRDHTVRGSTNGSTGWP